MTKNQIRSARAALNKMMEKNFTPEQLDEMEYYTDLEAEGSYSWRFKLPADKKMTVYTYLLGTRKIEVSQRPVPVNGW